LCPSTGLSIHDRHGKRFRCTRSACRQPASLVATEAGVERYLDLELNLYDLNVAADAVTEFYHDRGYTCTRRVPPQRVDDGVVTAVIEGRVGRLFSGNKGYASDFCNNASPGPNSLVATDRMDAPCCCSTICPDSRRVAPWRRERNSALPTCWSRSKKSRST
jgi:hypothetical protein